MSGNPVDRDRLIAIAGAVDRIQRFTKNLSYEEFLGNDEVKNEVIRDFEVIGNAALHISGDLQKKFPDADWGKIAAFRHILIQDQVKNNMEFIWDIKEQKLSALKAQIGKILDILE